MDCVSTEPCDQSSNRPHPNQSHRQWSGRMTRPSQSWRVGAVTINPLVCALTLAAALFSAAVDAQTLRERADGLLEVTDTPPGTVVRYTLDGTDPTRDAGVWLAPVEVP